MTHAIRSLSQLLRGYAPIIGLLVPLVVHANDTVWSKLREGGNIVLIRHALTPAQFGDPPGMNLDDCATQRNLTDAGREQAKRIGAAFAEQKATVHDVRSSRLCRCIDTAQLAFGKFSVQDELTAITQDTPERRKEKAEWLKRFLATRPSANDHNIVLVTHNFNIQDATGVSIAMGEALVIRPQGEANFEIIGRLAAP